LNVDIISGKSINAIRIFPGLGTLAWGARTLDGNSNDYKYINVRRTLIYIEQSIKEVTKAYVFAPNEATTWAKVEGIISHFLTEVWKQGGLAGPKPSDAFSVHVGLGTTMTSDDIKQGIMRVSAMVAVSHPAEFIILTIQQEMQKA
jgi:phage tail sheath protein FI